jgi:hypothetical protein
MDKTRKVGLKPVKPSRMQLPWLRKAGGVRLKGGAVWTLEKAPKGPVSIIVSALDRAAYIDRNGIEIGRSPVGRIPRLAGSHVYSALSHSIRPDDATGFPQLAWVAAPQIFQKLAKRVAIPPHEDGATGAVWTYCRHVNCDAGNQDAVPTFATRHVLGVGSLSERDRCGIT